MLCQHCGSSFKHPREHAEHERVLLGVVGTGLGHLAGLLEVDTAVHRERRVATVVEDHVRSAVGPAQRLLGAPPVLLERLALPREHRDATRVVGRAVGADRDRRGRVVLRGEDVARRPPHLGAEVGERLDEHRGLDRHVQRPGDARAGERLRRRVLLAQRHEAGHLVLGEVDLLATERVQREIGDLEVGAGDQLAGTDGQASIGW